VAVAGDPLEVRLLDSGSDRLVFVFNHAAKPATGTVTLRGVPVGEAEDLVSAQRVALAAADGGAAWSGTIGPRDVRVLRVARAAER
jgi:hypothetical protein